jgi:hypothetical protein
MHPVLMKICPTREQGNGLFAGIDQITICLAGRRRWSHTEYAVLAMQKNIFRCLEVIGDQRGQADTKINVAAFRNIAGYMLSDFIARKSLH